MPHSAWGRVVGSVVMIVGVTSLSVLTATVTSYFVSADQDQRMAEVGKLRGAEVDDTQALLREISDRLQALEERDAPDRQS